jgi:integrase
MAHIEPLTENRKKDGKRTGRWYAQIYLGRNPATGKPRFVSKTFAREKEAKEWASNMESERGKGLHKPSTDPKVKLAGFLRDMWLPSYRTQVSSTYNIEKTLGKWIYKVRPDIPFLGRITLKDLTVTDFDNLYVAMVKHGMQERGIVHLHGLLRRALKFAVGKKYLTVNPTDNATLPKPGKQKEIVDAADEEEGEVQYLKREQALRFLAVAKADRWSALWHLLLDGGLRPGEAFALKWRHMDWDASSVKVAGTLVRQGVPKRKAGGLGWKVMDPKTTTSKRDIPLSLATTTELRRWKKTQAAERLQMGPEWQDHGFIFATEFGTPLGNNMGRAWDRVLAKADGGKGDLGVWGPEPEKPRSGPTAQRTFTPRFPLYVLRHTSATLALLDDNDLLKVSRRLGHKNISITARFYGHVQAEHTGDVAESFNRLAASVGQ